MSIKLYGMPLSNYYNMVKAVLIEKGMEFEEILVKPNQDEEYLAQSPMGKVPCIETEAGFLTETGVIIDYIDALGEGPSFYPTDAFAKAKVQELIRYLELYIELPARRLFGEVFFGRPASAEEKAAVKGLLVKGFAALEKLAKFDPYIAGAEISYADFYFRYSVNLATIVCKKALDWDAFNELSHIKQLLDLMDERASVQRTLADQA
ncbi:MAG: glutathione S-transferase family protein [Pseudohongiellaceae bacterium]|jgi:glutathione S-transferase|tara:strand:+ start:34537 stop:35157 length:621 start_codon:yes stop_codon:yes gene_type:complete